MRDKVKQKIIEWLTWTHQGGYIEMRNPIDGSPAQPRDVISEIDELVREIMTVVGLEVEGQ